MSDPRSRHWVEHYARCYDLNHLTAARKLEYSNDQVMIQTYLHVLDGVGGLQGRRVLDVGCGLGTLAILMHTMGANVTAVDGVQSTIDHRRSSDPLIDWVALDLNDLSAVSRLPEVDIVTCVEVLQYVDWENLVPALWRLVSPAGRLVTSVPNADCPIVRKVAKAQGPDWHPVSWRRLSEIARGLRNIDRVAVKSLEFDADQTIAPYKASAWAAGVVGTPNRLVSSFLKR